MNAVSWNENIREDRDQPPLQLRRPAGALAKAEAREAHEESPGRSSFVFFVIFVPIVMSRRPVFMR
jgi:hypothetical protein